MCSCCLALANLQSVEAFERFGWNILGCIVLLLWTVALSFALFASLKMGGLLTVSPFADRYGEFVMSLCLCLCLCVCVCGCERKAGSKKVKPALGR